MNPFQASETISEDTANNYLIASVKYYDAAVIPYLRSELVKMTPAQFQTLQMTEKKDPLVLLLVSILAGSFGIDRILLGQVGLGIVKLITCGGLGIWTIVDWVLIMGETKKLNLDSFNQIAQFNRPLPSTF